MDMIISIIKNISVVNDLIRRNPYFYKKIEKVFQHLEGIGLEKRQSFTKELLERRLYRAKKTLYGKKVAADLRIEEWPFLSKETVVENPHLFKSKNNILVLPASTSGTSGTPLSIYRSIASITAEQLSIDTLLRKAGINPRTASIAILRGDTIKNPSDMTPPYWQTDFGRKRLLLSSHHLNPSTNQEYLKVLKEFNPHCLFAYPSSVESLGLAVCDMHSRLSIPLVITSSEMLPEETRELVKLTLCTNLIDHYGQAERVAFAYRDQNSDYRFLPGYGYIELLYVSSDNEYDTYEIVGTSLWNNAMPLIRYKTGDLIHCEKNLSKRELAEVCYGLRTFARIVGRQTDYLVSPNGVRLIGMNQIPRNLTNIVRVQLVQETIKEVRVLVLPDQGFSNKDVTKLEENLVKKIPTSMHWKIETVNNVELTKSGKAPLVISRL